MVDKNIELFKAVVGTEKNNRRTTLGGWKRERESARIAYNSKKIKEQAA